ncbi:MAG: hypothetical protein JXJ04_23805 [Spirochaetales bacterium]|nr:hypothetical protein [Spirochaetales bacterium]
MKKCIVMLLLTLFLVTGCTSTGFLGLAKESYAKELEEENTKLKEELEIVKNDMDKVLDLAGEMEQIGRMTKKIESRLDELPEETLRKLVDILENYLNKKEKVKEKDIDSGVDTETETGAQ